MSNLTTLVFTEECWKSLVSELDSKVETAWLAGVRVVGGSLPSNAVTLLVRHVYPVPDKAYESRTSNSLNIKSEGWVPSLARLVNDGCVPLFVHTHPNGLPKPSKRDIEVDDQILTVTKKRSSGGAYASLIVGGASSSPTFTGRLNLNDDWAEIDRLRIVGSNVTVLTSWEGKASAASKIYDRQIKAFGEEGQQMLSKLRVGIVGCGGTGSSVAEQLIRLGVGEIIAIDHQELAATNVTRVYGSGVKDSGKPKVAIVTKNSESIGLGNAIMTVIGQVTSKEAALSLSQCDIIFGCTDDNAGRTIITRMPQYLLQLLIDCGVVIDSRGGNINEIFGRVTIVGPQSPCLICTNDVDLERSRAELLSPEEYASLAHEGYVPELNTNDPSVVTYTTATASAAVNEMLARLMNFGEDMIANRLLYRYADRSISKSIRHRVGTHSCGDNMKLAFGVNEPFLGWGWSK